MNLEEAVETLGTVLDADRETVRRAYLRAVRQCSPERDPDGFQRLRLAYELALAHADGREPDRHQPAPRPPAPEAEPEPASDAEAPFHPGRQPVDPPPSEAPPRSATPGPDAVAAGALHRELQRHLHEVVLAPSADGAADAAVLIASVAASEDPWLPLSLVSHACLALITAELVDEGLALLDLAAGYADRDASTARPTSYYPAEWLVTRELISIRARLPRQTLLLIARTLLQHSLGDAAWMLRRAAFQTARRRAKLCRAAPLLGGLVDRAPSTSRVLNPRTPDVADWSTLYWVLAGFVALSISHFASTTWQPRPPTPQAPTLTHERARVGLLGRLITLTELCAQRATPLCRAVFMARDYLERGDCAAAAAVLDTDAATWDTPLGPLEQRASIVLSGLRGSCTPEPARPPTAPPSVEPASERAP